MTTVKKILYLVGSLDQGGTERHLMQVLPRLADLGFRPVVFTLTHKGRLAPVFEDLGIRVLEPWMARYLRHAPSLLRWTLLVPLSTIRLCVTLIRYNPAIVHFFLPQSYMLGSFCSFVTGNRIRVMSRRSLNLYQHKRPFLASVERWLHTRMNAVLGNSRAVTKELMQEGVGVGRLGLLYNGIDLAPFMSLPSRHCVRQNIGVGEKVLLLVCTANLIPYKGHAELLCALGEIHLRLPEDWRCAMVGRDCGIGAELRELAQRKGIAEHIVWLGERNDAIAIISAAEIGILSSHEEGFSNSLLEGMAAGLPMVVTAVGGNGEAVIDGESGIVVPSRDSSALGDAILTLVGNPALRERMGIAGRQRVFENFSLDACVNRYAGLYRALLLQSDCNVQKALNAVPVEIT